MSPDKNSVALGIAVNYLERPSNNPGRRAAYLFRDSYIKFAPVLRLEEVCPLWSVKLKSFPRSCGCLWRHAGRKVHDKRSSVLWPFREGHLAQVRLCRLIDLSTEYQVVALAAWNYLQGKAAVAEWLWLQTQPESHPNSWPYSSCWCRIGHLWVVSVFGVGSLLTPSSLQPSFQQILDHQMYNINV